MIQTPRIHSCEATPISKLLKKVKTEEENSESSGSSSKSPVIRFDNPLWNGENSEAIFSEDSEANRPNFRSVGPNGYEKAYSNGGTAGNRLIVFEENDLCNVKQYAGKNNKYWYCLGCLRSSKIRTKAYQQPDGTFLIPKKHDCRSITYEEAKKEQEKIIEKWNIGEKDCTVEGGNDAAARNESDSSTVNEPPKSPAPQSDNVTVCSRLLTRTHPAIILPSAPRPLGTFRRRRRKNNKSPSSNKRCFALDRTEKRTAILNERTGELLIPCNHICEKILYENVQKEQDLIQQRYANRSTSLKKPNKICQIINRSKLATENSSTPSSSSPKKIPPSQPIYSGAHLPTSTSQRFSVSQNQSINTPPPASVSPPRMSDACQSGVKRNADERSKKDEGSSAAKKMKPTERFVSKVKLFYSK
uniref:Uncharacterized protein n=1 Tax=Panagrolaimus superbus TaxID=310955 RepID=A0A914XXU7_9BILA